MGQWSGIPQRMMRKLCGAMNFLMFFQRFLSFWLLIIQVEGTVMDTETISSIDCIGSVIFESNQDLMFSTSMSCIRGLRVTTVIKEGCGCFKLHDGARGRGCSVTLVENGEHELTIKRVKSLYKISCSDEIDDADDLETTVEDDSNCIHIPAGSPLRKLLENITEIDINEHLQNAASHLTTNNNSDEANNNRKENSKIEQINWNDQNREDGTVNKTTSGKENGSDMRKDGKLEKSGKYVLSSSSRVSKNFWDSMSSKSVMVFLVLLVKFPDRPWNQ